MHCSLHNRPLRPRFNEEITNEASGPNHSAGNDQWSIRASHALRIPFAYKVPVVFREHPEPLDKLHPERSRRVGINSARDTPPPPRPPPPRPPPTRTPRIHTPPSPPPRPPPARPRLKPDHAVSTLLDPPRPLGVVIRLIHWGIAIAVDLDDQLRLRAHAGRHERQSVSPRRKSAMNRPIGCRPRILTPS